MLFLLCVCGATHMQNLKRTTVSIICIKRCLEIIDGRDAHRSQEIDGALSSGFNASSLLWHRGGGGVIICIQLYQAFVMS